MINKYIAIFDCNNGYTCSCCGKEWKETEIEEFYEDNYGDKDIINWFKRNEYSDGERTLNNVYKIEGRLLNDK